MLKDFKMKGILEELKWLINQLICAVFYMYVIEKIKLNIYNDATV